MFRELGNVKRHLTRTIGDVDGIDVLRNERGDDIALRVSHGPGQPLLTFAGCVWRDAFGGMRLAGSETTTAHPKQCAVVASRMPQNAERIRIAVGNLPTKNQASPHSPWVDTGRSASFRTGSFVADRGSWTELTRPSGRLVVDEPRNRPEELLCRP